MPRGQRLFVLLALSQAGACSKTAVIDSTESSDSAENGVESGGAGSAEGGDGDGDDGGDGDGDCPTASWTGIQPDWTAVGWDSEWARVAGSHRRVNGGAILVGAKRFYGTESGIEFFTPAIRFFEPDGTAFAAGAPSAPDFRSWHPKAVDVSPDGVVTVGATVEALSEGYGDGDDDHVGIARFADDGQTINNWSWSPASLAGVEVDGIATQNDRVFVAGPIDGDAAVMAFDTDGVLLWSALFPVAGSTSEYFTDIELTVAGELLVVRNAQVSGTSQAAILIIDTVTGDLLATPSLPSANPSSGDLIPQNLEADPDGGWWAAAVDPITGTEIVHLDDAFVPDWRWQAPPGLAPRDVSADLSADGVWATFYLPGLPAEQPSLYRVHETGESESTVGHVACGGQKMQTVSSIAPDTAIAAGTFDGSPPAWGGRWHEVFIVGLNSVPSP